MNRKERAKIALEVKILRACKSGEAVFMHPRHAAMADFLVRRGLASSKPRARTVSTRTRTRVTYTRAYMITPSGEARLQAVLKEIPL